MFFSVGTSETNHLAFKRVETGAAQRFPRLLSPLGRRGERSTLSNVSAISPGWGDQSTSMMVALPCVRCVGLMMVGCTQRRIRVGLVRGPVL